jgi:hypothetical protein
MKKRIIVAGWLTWTTLSFIVTFACLFDCCSMPFQRLLHIGMPPHCSHMRMAAPQTPDDVRDAAAPGRSAPNGKAAPIAPHLVADTRAAVNGSTHLAPLHLRRTLIAHGALRCDRDVGLHLLNATFLL